MTESGDPAPWHSNIVVVSAAGDLVAFGGDLPFQDQPSADPSPRLYYVGTGSTVRVPASMGNVGGQECYHGGLQLSTSGRYLLFPTPDPLDPADDNGECDTYVYDIETGRFEGVALGSWDYAFRWSAISGDGRMVALGDQSGVTVVDRDSGEAMEIANQSVGSVWLSAGGDLVGYREFGVNSADIVFVDLETGAMEHPTKFVTDRSDLNEPQRVWNASSFYALSPNGRWLAYAAEVFQDDTLVPWDPVSAVGQSLVIHDRDTGSNTEIIVAYEDLESRLGGANLANVSPLYISDDGTRIYFAAEAGGFPAAFPPPRHIYELDRSVHPLERVDIGDLEIIDVSLSGESGDWSAWLGSASADGSLMAFFSEAGNLMPGEINNDGPGFNRYDVFVAFRAAFSDAGASVFDSDIAWLADQGITKGCNPPANTQFCPDDPVTRGQMAAFLNRALNLDPGLDIFTDTSDSVFTADIGALAAAGITRGCNPPSNDEFCPEDVVTRGQMAAFLVRALGYTDDGGGNLFVDDDGSVFEDDIDRLGTAGVTRGCNPPTNDQFCPDDPVTRGQMAAFLRRALGN